MWELTVLWEENMEEALERKLAKHSELVERCTSRERCRGFTGPLLGLECQEQERRAQHAPSQKRQKKPQRLRFKRASPWTGTADPSHLGEGV